MGGVVLALSAGSFVALARQRSLDGRYLRTRGVMDGWLLLAWAALLAGGAALLAGRRWGAVAAPAGVAMVLAWAIFAAFFRLRMVWSLRETAPVRFGAALTGHLVVVAALAAAAGALAWYLHRPDVLAVLR